MFAVKDKEQQQKALVSSSKSLGRQTSSAPPVFNPVDPLLTLQRSLGNSYLRAMNQTTPNPDELRIQRACACSSSCANCSTKGDISHMLQPKLVVGAPNDKYEREADQVAEQVMRMPDLQIQRQIEPETEDEDETVQIRPIASQITPLVQKQVESEETEEETEEEEELQTKATSGQLPPVSSRLQNRILALRGGGQPLLHSERAFFEPRFGADFSQVCLHNDTQSAESVRAVNARAYTVGQHIVFGAGEYTPGTVAGRQLLAHELTHVVQQRGAFRSTLQPMLIQRQPTSIKLKEAKPFGHSDLISDGLKKKWRTYIGSTTLMQVTPSGNYKGHCVKEYLTEVANTCPSRFTKLRKGAKFCTASKCLDFDRWGRAGDASTQKMVSDGPDTFLDRHRTRHPKSLLEGSGKNKCSVVCHQLYKYDRKKTLGAFYVIRNFKAGSYKPTGTKTALHITTGDVQKVKAPRKVPSKEDFAQKIAPGIEKRGKLLDKP